MNSLTLSGLCTLPRGWLFSPSPPSVAIEGDDYRDWNGIFCACTSRHISAPLAPGAG